MIVPVMALIAASWIVLLVAAPMLPAPVAAILYALGSLICHQRPERSFHLVASQLPVCARCTGIYGGAAFGASIAALSTQIRTRAAQARARTLVAMGAIPVSLTLLFEWSGLWAGSNAVRAASGVALGIAVALVVVQAAATVHYSECAPRRPIASNRPSTHI